MPAKQFRPYPVGCGELLEGMRALERALGRLMDWRGEKCGGLVVETKIRQKLQSLRWNY
jgi:hypothetical protein